MSILSNNELLSINGGSINFNMMLKVLNVLRDILKLFV
jgi:hypothetical protein